MRRRSVTGARQIGHLLSPRAQASQAQKWPQPNATSSGRSWHTTHSFVDVVAMAARRASSLTSECDKAAALSHSLVREEARRAATATATTSECVVCQAAPLQIALGCGHFCACDACARGLSKCPICRAPVTERRRIYAS